ncbi:hypothetical protein [Corynebacterium urealyticum]|uniref:hypothetical protein n=1 Tax=Corynebacterium urealyticum TaxID=43771 RepID=UPI001F2BD061|nr:hypothetical protein [Corynebacterium urealyticum]
MGSAAPRELLDDARRNPDGLRYAWPARLRQEYGDAFALARRLGMLLTMPGLLAASARWACAAFGAHGDELRSPADGQPRHPRTGT